MFNRNQAQRIIRFLSDTPSLLDIILIIWNMPKILFIKYAIRSFTTQRYSSYQLILLTNLSILSWVMIIIAPNIFSMELQLVLLVTTVTVIGIPHRYFDFLVAKKLYSSISNWLLKFILIYLATSLVFICLTASPIFALILFLLMALYHFAVEETMNLKTSNYILMIVPVSQY